MALLTNKRQQARSERALQELLRSVPGNDVCADCQTRNPGWASHSLGIFLCVRCASFHRSMGTHISKVKSISMDIWSPEQVETMKRMGNTASNRLYNPRNVRPNIPLDADMVDSAMERFIRQKYQYRSFSRDVQTTPHHTGSTTSSDDRPPPPPPKQTPRFERAVSIASSTIPLSRTEQPMPRTPVESSISRTVVRVVGKEGEEQRSLEQEATTVGDCRALETAPSSSLQALSTLQPRRVVTEDNVYWQNQPVLSLASLSPLSKSLESPPSHSPLEQAAQTIKISQQPVHPNHSGTWPQRSHRNPFNSAPTAPNSPSQQQSTAASPSMDGFVQFSEQGRRPRTIANRNPFFQRSQERTPYPVIALSETPQFPPFSPPSLDEYNQPPQDPLLPSWNSLDQHTPQYVRDLLISPSSTVQPVEPYAMSQTQASFQPLNGPGSYYVENRAAHESVSHDSNPFVTQTHQPHHFPSKSTLRYDKNSILALYGQPRSASALSSTSLVNEEKSPTSSQMGSAIVRPVPRQKHRSATMPASLPSDDSTAMANLIPFANLTMGSQVAPRSGGHTRDESHEFSGRMMTSGRHSPDAFADLSARYA